MNIFEQSDYKVVLKQAVEAKGKAQRGFYRKLAEYLGVNPSLISHVIAGDKDFTEEQIVLVCEFLGLSQLESRYVLALVQVSRAGSVKLKNYHLEQLADLKAKALDLSKRISVTRTLTDGEQARFYSSWIYSAIQLATTLEKPPRFQDMCERFHLDQKTAQEILSFLLEIGMITEKNGVYAPGPSLTHLEKTSPYIINYHRNWRMTAMQATERLTPEDFMYSCNFSVSRKDFLALREEFVKVAQKFLATVEASPAEDLAQFNLDLFWLRG